jgi:hypothetical protein
MNEIVARLEADRQVSADVLLRSRTLAWHEGSSVIVVNDQGNRVWSADWDVYSLEMTPDGEFLLALGDDGKRASIWEVRSGRKLLDYAGNVNRRQSLRAGLGLFDRELYALFYNYSNNVAVVRVRDGAHTGWMATTGMIWYHVSRFTPLNDRWLAIQGYHDGESRETIVAFPALDVVADPMVLYSALSERPSVLEWGYRAAVGPGGEGHAVFFRDPEWDEDEEPEDDSNEAFRGLVFWDLDRREVVQRVPYNGDPQPETLIGANARRAVVPLKGGGLDVVSLEDGSVVRAQGTALDPYRLEAALIEDGRVAIIRL